MEEIIMKVSVYLAVGGFIVIIFALLTGLRIIKVKSNYKVHKRMAIIGFTAICVHAVIMSYFYFLT